MWAKVIEKDLTDTEVLAEGALRAKWEANPITEIANTEIFLKYVLSVLQVNKQAGMNRITDAFTAMAAAVTHRIFRGSRHGGSGAEFAERAAKRGTPRNAHGTGMLSAPRKVAEGRGRSRKAAELK